MTRHELHAYDYVNRPYDAVRLALLADPVGVFRRATTSTGQNPELHAKAGPLDIAAEVAVDILEIEDTSAPDGKPATRLKLQWKATHNAGVFPTMQATLSLYALSPSETQLDFAGTYVPPLGVVGQAVDAIAMHRIAVESVHGFVRDIATFLRPPH